MSITAAHNSNFSLFSNLQGGTYWSGVSDAVHGEVWTFAFGTGGKGKTSTISVSWHGPCSPICEIRADPTCAPTPTRGD